MAWDRRGFVIYPAPLPENVADLKANTAQIFAQTAGLESLANEMAMFDNAMRLSDDGGATVTHRCINTALTAQMDATLQQAFAARAGELVGLTWFVVDAVSGELLATNSAQALGGVFTLNDALALLGLEVYQDEVI